MSTNSSQSKTVWSFSAVGKDRPGIVAALSKVFYQQGCNLLDSSMTRLGDQFAVVMLLEASTSTRPDLLMDSLNALGKEWGLLVAAGPIKQDLESLPLASGNPILVSVYGADQTGIMAKTTEIIAKHEWSVADLSTKQIAGSTPVYILLLEITAGPQSSPLETLSKELQGLGNDMGCSVTLKEVESSSL